MTPSIVSSLLWLASGNLAPVVPVAGVAQGTMPTALAPKAGRRKRITNPAVRRISAAGAAATHEPQAEGFVNTVQVYPFSDGALYHVYAAPGHITDIMLQPGEALGAVAAGDTVRWIIGDTSSGSGEGKRTHVLVKPFTAGLSTNVVITTDRRTYHLSLSSVAGAAMTALAWSYAEDEIMALERRSQGDGMLLPVARGVSLEALHFNYQITGDSPRWKPLRAFDDGRQTFIEFPEDISASAAPPLFVLDADNKPTLVNYRLRGHFYVVDRLFDIAELRLGTKRQTIVRVTRLSPRSRKRRAP